MSAAAPREAESLDAVFAALASRERRQMLDIVLAHPGCGVARVAAHFAMSRIGVLKHLRLLEAAGLLLSEKQGRVRHLFFNAVPIQRIHRRWTDRYGALFAGPMAALKERVESHDQRRNQSRA
jgi:DNA-binding transcriptional ArsR family regulator